MYKIQPTEEMKAIAEINAMNTHVSNALGQLKSFTQQAYDAFWFGETSPTIKVKLLGDQAIKVFTDCAEVQGFLASKIEGHVPLGVPAGYNVMFSQAGSAEIVYTEPVIEEAEEDIPPFEDPPEPEAEL